MSLFEIKFSLEEDLREVFFKPFQIKLSNEREILALLCHLLPTVLFALGLNSFNHFHTHPNQILISKSSKVSSQIHFHFPHFLPGTHLVSASLQEHFSNISQLSHTQLHLSLNFYKIQFQSICFFFSSYCLMNVPKKI